MNDLRILSLAELPSLLLNALAEGENAAVLVALTHPEAGFSGRRVLVTERSSVGTLGDPEADSAALALARKALTGSGKARTGTYPLLLADGREMDVFLELHHPTPELVIVGAGHVAQPLCTLGALLGLEVTILDDRPQLATAERFPEAHRLIRVDFGDPFADVPLHAWSHVVLVTRGHKYDYECLRGVLQEAALPAYIGMIGSRRRVRATFEALLKEGIPRERLTSVHAPIGLDIGGETPAEIAVSVAAELVRHKRGGTGRPLSELEHVLDRFYPQEPGSETPGEI